MSLFKNFQVRNFTFVMNKVRGGSTLGKPIMMFRVHLINYLVKLHLKCINEYCIRISEIFMYSKMRSDDRYENKAYFILVKNRKTFIL